MAGTGLRRTADSGGVALAGAKTRSGALGICNHSHQPPAAVPPAPEPALLTITVPSGAQPGQQIQIKAPDGRVVAVTIPNGLQEGSQFQVKI